MKRFLTIFTCLIILSCQLYAQKTRQKQKHHRARIFFSTPTEFQTLSTLGIDLDHGLLKKMRFIESDYADQELQIVQNAGFKTEIIINDVQAHYINQNSSLATNKTNSNSCQALSYSTPSNFQLGSMGGFFTYEEILAELDSMASLYPNLITTKAPISDLSTEEGRSIFWMRMSDNPEMDESEPEILYDAVHHAREPASVATLIYYMWYLLENYDTDTEVQAILNNTELYFVPVVNPDGYVHNVTTHPNGGGLWRKNRRNNGDGSYGVDNNRNYSYAWGTTGISFNPSSQVYPGTAPFSEIENQAIKWFCENHEFVIAFNNHSYGNLLLYPFGYQVNTPSPDHELFEAISGEMVCENNFINQLAAELYPASGDSDDWMYIETAQKPKILAFTPEIGASSQGFWPAANEIIDLCNSTMYMNLTAAHMVTKHMIIEETSPSFYSSLNNNIPFTIKRMGLQDAVYTVSITPISSNIFSTGSSIVFSDLDLLEEESGIISIELINSIQNGDVIEYNIIIDNGNYSSSKTITKVYGQEQIVFEQTEDITIWESTDWNITYSEFVSNPSSITDSPELEYGNNLNSSIETKEIDLTNALAAELSFQTKWEIEQDWDYVQIEVSIDNGITWIPQCGNYTHSGGSYQAVGEPLYDGFQMEWVEEKINLENYIGEIIKIRFQLVTDEATTEDGFYFDNFIVKIIPEDCFSEIPVPCDDNNPNTIDDIIQEDCSCVGSYYLELDLKTFLQGPYNFETEIMDDNLRTLPSFPLTEPFTIINENLILGGGEVTTEEVLSYTGENAIVDWILVELRDGENPSEIIQTQAALIQRDGDIVSASDGTTNLIFQDHSTNFNSIFIAIKHRNHFGIRNLEPVVISNESLTISFDFSDPSLSLYGGDFAMENMFGVRLMISGDANRDGQINAVDKNSYWQVENGNPFDYLNTKTDFNLDGAINPVDKNSYWQINNSKIQQLD